MMRSPLGAVSQFWVGLVPTQPSALQLPKSCGCHLFSCFLICLTLSLKEIPLLLFWLGMRERMKLSDGGLTMCSAACLKSRSSSLERSGEAGGCDSRGPRE
ncbi:unnamed protein product [Rangifer tarandus platyrhynchus]|uniref:Uncharacterized protein n=2 Tax=Rangifer tarandus platyrhynchus TaxID=3082113 RepID=A0ABN8ZHT7_RANTA|nr:unnamed protein product [Rangifer tarandus platyrhynchus]